MNFSGTVNFDFEIERYRDRDTNELVTYNDSIHWDDENFEFIYETISLNIIGHSSYQAGRSYGPPEDCDPSEGDTQIESALGPDGKDWTSKLTAEELSSILLEIQEGVMPDDDYDDDYEPESDRMNDDWDGDE